MVGQLLEDTIAGYIFFCRCNWPAFVSIILFFVLVACLYFSLLWLKDKRHRRQKHV